MVCFSFINMDIQHVSYLCKFASIANIQFLYIKLKFHCIYNSLSVFYMVCFSFINMDIQDVSYLCKCVTIANIQFVYIELISLSTVVLNSRDRHEKTWRPTFTHLHHSPHNILFTKKPTKIHL